MLTLKNRLISSCDFAAVHRRGHFFSFEGVSLKVAKNGLENTRIGFSIGLKFSPKAADRNKAKRWLREIAKKHLKEMRKGFDVVVMLKKERIFPTRKKLEQDFERVILLGNLLIK